MAHMKSQSNAINSSRASHAIREASVNSMKASYRIISFAEKIKSYLEQYIKMRAYAEKILIDQLR
jgi:hypothetical protein